MHAAGTHLTAELRRRN